MNADAKVVSIAPIGLATDNRQVAAALRELADEVEADEFGDVDFVIAVLESDGGILRRCIGKPGDRARTVGLLTWAARLVMEGDYSV